MGECAHPTVSSVVLFKKARGGGDPTSKKKSAHFVSAKLPLLSMRRREILKIKRESMGEGGLAFTNGQFSPPDLSQLTIISWLASRGSILVEKLGAPAPPLPTNLSLILFLEFSMLYYLVAYIIYSTVNTFKDINKRSNSYRSVAKFLPTQNTQTQHKTHKTHKSIF